MVLPYISMVQEKTAHLATIAEAMGVRVKGYFGDASISGAPLQPRHAYHARCMLHHRHKGSALVKRAGAVLRAW